MQVTAVEQDRPQASGRGVLEGAFLLLDVLAQTPGIGLSALSACSGLPKATVYRLLEQLSALGVVEREGSAYQIGYHAFELGRSWPPYRGLRTALRGPARDLACATGASVAGCVVRGEQTLILGSAPGRQGPAEPLAAVYPWSTAAGKVVVAFTGVKVRATRPAAWRHEAALIRERGIAQDDDTVLPGIRSLAVPIHGAEGEVIAALTAMVGSSARTDGLERGLRRAAATVSAALRAESPPPTAARATASR
jgi:IclR family transcriptional regulator, acetate operon repressor